MKLFIPVLIVAFITLSCGSAQKSFEKGDYISAFEKAAKELKAKPDDKNLEEIVKSSYKAGVTQQLDKVKTLESGNDPYKYEKIAAEYASINKMYDILQSVDCCDNFKESYRDFKEEQHQALNFAAETRYHYGEQAMTLNSREGAKQAYFEFSKAAELIPGYKDAAQLAQQSRDAATVTIFIQDFANAQPYYSLNYNPFYNQVSNYLFQLNRPGSFTQFINGSTPGYNVSSKQPDQVIQLSFPMISFSPPLITKQTVNNSQQVGTGKKNADGKEIMQTVTSTVTIYTKTVNTRAELFYQILDNHTGAFIYSNRAYSDYLWTYTWATVQGDRRALDANNQRLIGLTEIAPPQNQFLFDELTRRLYDDFTYQINNFYSNY
ncbi:hypothetical protein C3K47_00615 [Solitalea longa]|uniref:Uncharacterized protein n=1 Tax=Solitalea longa TaxID=2079460 RepID=A0A2S5A936_9SPHI|nr:hypothetical protein [Solitalea longa]POY39036.1 hypothetical protein C3K47_00615 [Solitalea longa]